MKCEKCGGKVYIVETMKHEWDGDVYKIPYICRCEDCNTKFLYNEIFEMTYTRTDCKEI